MFKPEKINKKKKYGKNIQKSVSYVREEALFFVKNRETHAREV